MSQPQAPRKVHRFAFAAARLSALAALANKTSLYITARGLLLLLFLLYLIKGPVFQQADIVAAVLAYSLLAVIFIAALVTLVYGQLVRRGLGVNVVPSFTDLHASERLESGKTAVFVIRLNPVYIPPLFEMTLTLRFAEETLRMPVHTLKGNPRGEQLIAQEITFPHRGVWEIGGAALSFGDQLGLTCLRWEVSADVVSHAFKVCPPRIPQSRLPVVCSCFKTGDELVDVQERRGEPFDLKRYHPSDGVRKIVWKIFAKSGQLMSRHAEPAMSPEGQVALICLAKPQEDAAAGAAIAYLRRLEELELEVFFACEGMTGDSPARSAEAAEDALVNNVWRARSAAADSTRRMLENFVGHVNGLLRGPRLERIVVFASAARLGEETGLALFTALGELLERQRIEPAFLLLSPPAADEPAAIEAGGRASWAKRWFLTREEPQERTRAAFYPDFMSLSLRKHWQVIADQSV